MASQPNPARPGRPRCPQCGSDRTQPYPHAGPGARINMQCLVCSHLFRDPPKKQT